MNLLWLFQKKNSGEIARKRLKSLVSSDKLNCSPELLELIKDDLIHMISKYMEIDVSGVSLEISRGQGDKGAVRRPCLCANIPIEAMSCQRTF